MLKTGSGLGPVFFDTRERREETREKSLTLAISF